METFPSNELVRELEKRGMKLVPTNGDALAIKDEPKWTLAKLEDDETEHSDRQQGQGAE